MKRNDYFVNSATGIKLHIQLPYFLVLRGIKRNIPADVKVHERNAISKSYNTFVGLLVCLLVMLFCNAA